MSKEHMSDYRGLTNTIVTKYRIITDRSHAATDRYLQFQDSKGIWRFVPKEVMHVLGRIDENSCYDSLEGSCGWRPSRVMGCLINYENELSQFPKRFPDINGYFQHMNSLADKHQEEEKIKNNVGTTYLT